MSKATATLAFGITLVLTDLCLLACALPNVEPALRGVDLIVARRRSGRLETAGHMGEVDVCALPVELWDMIKAALIKEALADEVQQTWKRYDAGGTCACWDEYEKTGRRGCGKPRANTFEFEYAVALCDEAYKLFLELGGVPEIARSNEEIVGQLLDRFGLCLADPTPLTKRGDPLNDFDASWAVTFSSSRSSLMQNSAILDVEPEFTSTHGLAHLPPSTFDVPPDARARFAGLLATFPWLEPTRLPGTGDPPTPPSIAWGPTTAHLPDEERWMMGRREVSARRREEQRIGREPGWMLLNVAA